MIALNLALLLIAAPAIAQSEGPAHERKLWWNAFWDNTTKIVNDIVDRAQGIWNHIGLDKLFPKVTDAIEDVIDKAGEVWNDLRRGLTQFIGHATSFWKSATEGVNKTKTPVENFQNILFNVDQVLDCNVNTYEILMDVKCGVNKDELLAKIKEIANEKLGGDQIKAISIAEQQPCEGDMAYQATELEFDIATDKADFIENTFKPALAKWNPAEEQSLQPYLTAQQPDAAISSQVPFCEAYNAGAEEFRTASDSIKELVEEIKELVAAAKEEGEQQGGAIRSFFANLWKFFKKDPVDEKLEQKKAEKKEAEKKQEHGMKAVMGVIDQCNKGFVRGPKTNKGSHPGEEVCVKTRRLSEKRIIV